MIYGLVLAAGESRRMGQPKLLLPFGEATVIESVLKAARDSKLNATLVVCHPQTERIAALAQGFSLEVVVNPHPERGMLSSILIGLNHIPQQAEAMVVILADQPAITSSLIDRLIVGYRIKRSGIIVPVYEKKRGHPVLIDLKYRQEICELDPEIGLRALLREHPDDILEIPVDESAAVLDIDTPEDYLRLRKNEIEGRWIKSEADCPGENKSFEASWTILGAGSEGRRKEGWKKKKPSSSKYMT